MRLKLLAVILTVAALGEAACGTGVPPPRAWLLGAGGVLARGGAGGVLARGADPHISSQADWRRRDAARRSQR
jgi:hypothetical protein